MIDRVQILYSKLGCGFLREKSYAKIADLRMLKPREYFGNATAVRLTEALLARESPPNTLLFSGPGAVGKALLAYFFAKALVCERRESLLDSPLSFCDECYACKSIEEGNQPEFVGIRPKTTELTLAQVREDYSSFESAYLHPHNLKWRIFILEECHTMSEELANSMLKLLEEPPLRTIFILVTDKPYLLLPTILSRSFRVSFNAENIGRLEEYLVRFNEENLGKFSGSAIKLSAYFSQGRVGLAKALLIDRDFLPRLAALLARFGDVVKRVASAKASISGLPCAGLLGFREGVLQLADSFFQVLQRIEENQDLPPFFYLLPWRRISLGEQKAKLSQARRNELARSALRFVFECLRLALVKAEEEGSARFASASVNAFSEANSMLDVNLRAEQVVDYLLSSLCGEVAEIRII